MKLGKFGEPQLKRSILKGMQDNNDVVLSKAQVGVDAVVLHAIDGQMVTTTTTVSMPIQRPAYLAVVKAMNNLYVAGATPRGIMLAITVPEHFNESKVRALVDEAKGTMAKWENVSLLGGHTELSIHVSCPIISVTALGVTDCGFSQKALSEIVPDMDIIMTKWTGMEATYLLAENHYEKLCERFSKSYIDLALSFGDHISVSREAAVLKELGIHAMHDVSTGGVFAGIWEVLEPSGLGCRVDLKQIPIKQETIELAEYFNENPYMLTGAGSLLAVVADGQAIVEQLAEHDIFAAVIGKTTKAKQRAVCIEIEEEGEWIDTAKTRRRKAVEERYLIPPQSDAIYTLLSDIK